jgi:dephospho-CoA kinase
LSSEITAAECCKRFGIGLTGGIASGKSTVSKLLQKHGFVVIDADQLARDAVKKGSTGLAAIVGEFGGGVLHETGELNRKTLGECVFSSDVKRKKLESILHPIIRDLLHIRLKDLSLLSKPQTWFYEASLLYESRRDADFRQVWAVVCSRDDQVRRVIHRDKKERQEVEKILNAQMSNDEKRKRADVVIDTSESMELLEHKVKFALDRLPGRSGIAPLLRDK